MKYIFLQLKTRDGEREYYHLSVHAVDNAVTLDDFAEDYLKDFWGEGEKDGDGYYFHGGEIYTEVSRVEEIGTLEYQNLKEYL